MWTKLLCRPLCLLLAAGVAAADIENPAAYSLELDEGLKPRQGFYPLGVLGGEQFVVLPRIGFNFTEEAHCCYPFKEGKACDYPLKQVPQNGLAFMAVWAAHTLWFGGETATHGPVIRPVDADGKAQEGPWGDYFAPSMHDYILAAARHTVEEVLQGQYKVFMWNIDNEWDPVLNYSDYAKAAFRRVLEEEYAGDIAPLNDLWGSGYADFSGIEPPHPSEFLKKPAAWLAWHAFSEEAYTDFVAEYLSAVVDADPERRPIVSKSTQCSIEMTYVARLHANNLMRLADKTRRISGGWLGIDMYGHNDRSAYETNYLYNCIRPTQAQKAAGEPEGKVFHAETNNHVGPGWQFAQTFWRLPANGMRGVDFYYLGRYKAAGDSLTFSFLDGYDGQPRDRFFYLARFANMLHRSEALWSNGLPLEGVPKVAMLMPQRDILLSLETNRSLWDYSVNDRLNVFRRLRDAGYWVDVLPYSKLEDDFLSRYQALFLVSAEHLTSGEAEAVKRFAAAGGIVLADMMPGFYDEKHRIVHGLDDLLGLETEGVYSGIHFSPDDVWYADSDGEFLIRGDGRIRVKLNGATLLNAVDVARNGKAAWLTYHPYGKGGVYWFGTRLGVLRAESSDDAGVTTFLTSLLRDSGVAPAYASPDGGNCRVEIPVADAQGNMVMVVASLSNRPLAAGELRLKLPVEVDTEKVWYGAAENNRLVKVAARREEGELILALPEIASAGVVYLLADHPPLLGIGVKGAERSTKNDPHTPLLLPGESVQVEVDIVDFRPAGSGRELTLSVADGWTAVPAAIAADGLDRAVFTLTPPAELSADMMPHLVHAVVATLTEGGERVAVANQNAMLAWDPSRVTTILTDNAEVHSEAAHIAVRTGADYRFITPEALKDGQEIRDPGIHDATNGKPALFHGVKAFWGLPAEAVFVGLPEVTVEVDLKEVYAIDELQLARGTQETLSGLAVRYSEDGEHYSEAVVLPARELGMELRSFPVEGVRARYLRLDLAFAGGEGTFGEIKVLGKALE